MRLTSFTDYGLRMLDADGGRAGARVLDGGAARWSSGCRATT